jgi:hypothetical protein
MKEWRNGEKKLDKRELSGDGNILCLDQDVGYGGTTDPYYL